MSIEVNIRKKLGTFTLDVAFSAEQETLALLGDSGCGKSVTLRCIAGIINPDSGYIRINGETVFDSEKKINLKPQKRRVGYLFQNYALFPNMTVCENIMVGLEREKKLSRTQRREKAREYIRLLHLEGLEDSYPVTLSGGQQQRTALARILASQPDLLLLDEPFSALDATLRWEMEQVVRETIQSFQGSTLLVSHDRDEVYRLSDKVAVYRAGHIDAFDDKWRIFSDPVTASTARLTGCKNISRAHIEGSRIIADDWGISFPLLQQGGYDSVGIRAHHFRLCEEDAQDAFSFPYELVRRIEDTFSYTLEIRARGQSDRQTLRWEIDKSQHAEIPDTGYVSIAPEDLLLLKQ